MGKEKKRKHSSDSSGSDSSGEKKKLHKLQKKLRKEQKKTERALKKKLKEEKRKLKKRRSKSVNNSQDQSKEKSTDIPIELMERSKAMAPMTKEEWEQRQSVVRKVLDEASGRYRLIKGDGEVLEEIVSKERQKQINKQATNSDGVFFQAHTVFRKY